MTARYSAFSALPTQGAGQRSMWNCRHGEPDGRPGFAPPAGAHREHAAQHVQGLAHLGGAGVRPEVEVALAVRLAGEQHPGALVLHGDHDVRVRLVVAQADVERRPVLLDEVVLQQQGLHLVADDDPFEARGAAHHLPFLGAHPRAVGAHGRRQIVRQTPAQRQRLAHVDDVAGRPAVQVDPGQVGGQLDLFWKVGGGAHSCF